MTAARSSEMKDSMMTGGAVAEVMDKYQILILPKFLLDLGVQWSEEMSLN